MSRYKWVLIEWDNTHRRRVHILDTTLPEPKTAGDRTQIVCDRTGIDPWFIAEEKDYDGAGELPPWSHYVACAECQRVVWRLHLADITAEAEKLPPVVCPTCGKQWPNGYDLLPHYVDQDGREIVCFGGK